MSRREDVWVGFETMCLVHHKDQHPHLVAINTLLSLHAIFTLNISLKKENELIEALYSHLSTPKAHSLTHSTTVCQKGCPLKKIHIPNSARPHFTRSKGLGGGGVWGVKWLCGGLSLWEKPCGSFLGNNGFTTSKCICRKRSSPYSNKKYKHSMLLVLKSTCWGRAQLYTCTKTHIELDGLHSGHWYVFILLLVVML
jgi:hypothetical protein